MPAFERCDQCFLIDEIAARRVDEARTVLHQSDAPRVDHAARALARGAVQRQDIGLAHQPVERVDIACAEHPLDRFGEAFAVVIGDLEAEGAGAMRHRLADPAHADDAKHLARQLAAQQRGRRPAGPLAGTDQLDPLAHPARHADDARHGQIGGILGEDTGRVRHHDPPRGCRLEVDMIGPRTEIGDQAEAIARLCQHIRIDPVGHRGDEHVAIAHRRDQFLARHRLVGGIALRIEQLTQPRFDGRHQVARHHDAGGMVETPGDGRGGGGIGHDCGLGAALGSGQAANHAFMQTLERVGGVG